MIAQSPTGGKKKQGKYTPPERNALVSHDLTPSQENYLEHIHRLSQNGPVRMREIAEATAVRLPSVTRAVSRLAASGLVRHQAYGKVEITERGVRAALAVMRRDNCLQALLVDVLSMKVKDAETEVCRLEYVLSTEVLARLEILLGHATSPDSNDWLGALHGKLRRSRAGRFTRSGAQVGNASLHARRRRP